MAMAEEETVREEGVNWAREQVRGSIITLKDKQQTQTALPACSIPF